MLITGDFDKLDRFRSNLQRVAGAGLTVELAQRLGETSLKLVADEFRAQRNPYGVPWKPLARERTRDRRARRRAVRQGKTPKGQKILQRTGRMMASVNASADATGFRLMIPVVYAPFHQYGTGRMAQRQILPMASTGGLGPIWLRAFNQSALDLLKRRLQVAA